MDQPLPSSRTASEDPFAFSDEPPRDAARGVRAPAKPDSPPLPEQQKRAKHSESDPQLDKAIQQQDASLSRRLTFSRPPATP